MAQDNQRHQRSRRPKTRNVVQRLLSRGRELDEQLDATAEEIRLSRATRLPARKLIQAESKFIWKKVQDIDKQPDAMLVSWTRYIPLMAVALVLSVVSYGFLTTPFWQQLILSATGNPDSGIIFVVALVMVAIIVLLLTRLRR